jgi:hypothetical protein
MKGRTISGRDVLPQAMEAMHTAKTVQELRQAQAVVLPLLLDLRCRRLPGTGCLRDLGRCTAPALRQGRQGEAMPTPPRGGRRQDLSREQEQAFLEPFLGAASAGNVVVVAAVTQVEQ